MQRGASLTDAAIIAALPDTWLVEDEQPQAKKQKRVSALEAYSSGRDYEALLLTLRELSEKREMLGRKRAQVECLSELVAPLGEPAQNVQPNLVSAAGRGKTGELEAEMERMKVLIERVDAVVEGLG